MPYFDSRMLRLQSRIAGATHVYSYVASQGARRTQDVTMLGGHGGETRVHGELLRLAFPALKLVDKFDNVIIAEATGVSNLLMLLLV